MLLYYFEPSFSLYSTVIVPSSAFHPAPLKTRFRSPNFDALGLPSSLRFPCMCVQPCLVSLLSDGPGSQNLLRERINSASSFALPPVSPMDYLTPVSDNRAGLAFRCFLLAFSSCPSSVLITPYRPYLSRRSTFRNLTPPCFDTWHHLNVPTVVGSLLKFLALALVRYVSLPQFTKS